MIKAFFSQESSALQAFKTWNFSSERTSNTEQFSHSEMNIVTPILMSLSSFITEMSQKQTKTCRRRTQTMGRLCHVSGNFLPFKGKSQSLFSQAAQFFSFEKGIFP
jgi:hypothetical protein